MTNKEFEEKMFKQMYNVDRYDDTDYKDKPDVFITKKSGVSFGVEMTGCYHSETSARLMVDDEFGLNLINGKEKIPKDDLKLVEIKDIDPSPLLVELGISKMIYFKSPDKNQFVKELIERIGDKNKKYKKYDDGLKYTNLTVFTDSIIERGITDDIFSRIFLNDELSKLIINSPYREINLMANFPSRGFVPLKTSLMVYESDIFFEALNKVDSIKINEHKDELFQTLVGYLMSIGFKDVSLCKYNNEYNIMYGDWMIAFTEARTEVREQSDFLKPNIILNENIDKVWENDEFFLKKEAVKKSYAFENKVLLPLKFI
ncbi:hypothetical protein [Priestia megaterium]|uniref:hypothetical protein n=1 Tax=Priestia megaterium TaxID=1404 RepID=UPI002877BBE7|nr:hypothetical protein [Priestia megaterium]